MKRILITGAAGFVGFHLARRLKERGDLVIGIDNFNSYYPVALKEARQLKLGIPLLKSDIRDFDFLNKLVEKEKITHIVHLAAQAGVRYSLTDPKAYLESNVDGFLSILELCRHHPEIFLTYASSSSVYGNNQKVPFSEKDRVELQASLYGVTKRSNELMAQTYHHLFGVQSTGLRFFTVYGPWGRPDMAYYSFTDKIIKGKEIDVYNHGKAERDFTYIDDIIDGTVSAIDKESILEIFNLGNHTPVPLITFIETLEELLGKKALMNFLPAQSGDVVTTYADISHSQKELHFNPKTQLKQGLSHFIQWYINENPLNG